LRPIALRSPGFCSWSYQFLSWSQRTIALHHRDPAEAERRWRGRGLEPISIGPPLATTDALFAGNVEGKVSNPLAHLPAARSFLDRTKLAAGTESRCRGIRMLAAVRETAAACQAADGSASLSITR
jgi:hypothetical protein